MVESLTEGKSYFDDVYLVNPKETDLDLPDQFDDTKSNNPHLRSPAIGQGKRKFIDKGRLKSDYIGEEEDMDINEVELTFPLVNFGNDQTMKGQGHMGAEFKGLDVDDPEPLDEEITNTNNKQNIIKALNLLPFKDLVREKDGNIYAVGGVVRDALLGKPSSDLDIVITKIDKDTLIEILSKYGKADFTGTEFGVIKFNPNKELKSQITALGFEDIIDIALPRADKASGVDGGHKDIEAMVDPNMSIEDDLRRRDFTINSIALSLDGTLVDPFNGSDDLKNGLIRWTNPESFLDDPLRIIRAIRFAAIYGYDIGSETKEAITKHKDRLSALPVERIYMEFKKMEKKGGYTIFGDALTLMLQSDLFETIFKAPFKGNIDAVDKAKNVAEFFWLSTMNSTDNPGQLFIDTLKGEVDEKKYIDALNLLKPHKRSNPESKKRWLVFKINKTHPAAIKSELTTKLYGLNDTVESMMSGKYPLTFKELAINGDDLIALGFKGKEIGEVLVKITDLIYNDKLPNDKEKIMLSLNNSAVNDLDENFDVIRELRDDSELDDFQRKLKHLNLSDFKLVQKDKTFYQVTYEIHLKDPQLNKQFKNHSIEMYGEDTPFPTIDIELDNSNRIHFSGIPDTLQRIGLGRKAYTLIANKLGFITSLHGHAARSDDAEMLWKSIFKTTSNYWFTIVDKVDVLFGENKLDDESTTIVYLLGRYDLTFDDVDKYNTNIDEHYLTELKDSYDYLFDDEV